MKIANLTQIYFSPTGSTKKIVSAISKSFHCESYDEIDITKLENNSYNKKFKSNDIVIIGAPVYRGNIPQDAIERLQNITSNGAQAVVIAVYGNRGLDQALLELEQIVQKQGFTIIASGSFIGEHSFTHAKFPIAANRPDTDDLSNAAEFGRQIKKAVADFDETNFIKDENITHVEFERKPTLRLAPLVNHELCTKCGKCAESCPTDAIVNQKDVMVTDQEKCITCFACYKVCPTNARLLPSSKFMDTIENLYNSCRERKEPSYEIKI